MPVPDEMLNAGQESPDATATELLQQVLQNQQQLQAAIAQQNQIIEAQRRENEVLRRELDAKAELRRNGMEFHPEVPMTEDERWKRMESPGGLLG